MKKKTHPTYGPSRIACACGNVIETRSTQSNLQVEICSACHPFFTGKQKLVDTAGRIDRFKKKFQDRVALGSLKTAKKASWGKAPQRAGAKLSTSPKEKLQALKEKVAPKKK